MSFYEQKTIVLCQNGILLNHAASCKLFHKKIAHVECFAKYRKPCLINLPDLVFEN